ncbi:hypothetical protein Tam1G_1192 [Bifidobacterium imperatoris]|uniref:Uncharacterized protein n=1 Tax=Bifidobacterium imperatoris TaxID=2020965 RepID=A0A2N5IS29_9BIFI|nr:hypothetical protein Tam1G_1192 [Bifidobacterium imperatoris]
MLDINMSDVIAVLKSLTPYLVVLRGASFENERVIRSGASPVVSVKS